MKRAWVLLLPVCLSARAVAADWIVDAAGIASPLTNITQAMALVSTGDRILVMPGSYPAFHFSRSVDVVGLGSRPADVVITRVDFHPTIPTLGFDCGLSNVTVQGDSYSISGNELASGTFVVDGVQLDGGVFLHGAGQFYLLMQNCAVHAEPGDGFLDAAFDFGGGIADIVTSSITGAPSNGEGGASAGIGLRIWPGASVRVSDSHIVGGSGHSALGSDTGGDAIERWSSSPASLRLSGGSQIRGGDAPGPGGHGGAGVDLSGVITVGDAVVAGGAGAIPGVAYAASQPTLLGYDPRLVLAPAGRDATSSSFQHPGDFVRLDADASLSSASLSVALQLDPPGDPSGSPLAPAYTQVFGTPSEAFMLPVRAQRVADPAPRRRAYFQASFVDPTSGLVQTTNPVAMAIDP